MLSTIILASIPILAGIVPVLGQSCNASVSCGQEAPCCSEFGFCGEGTYCLGGCNPLYSFALDSCAPEPICQDATYTFEDPTTSLINSTLYNGNASSFPFTLDKGTVLGTSTGDIGLILTETNGGTRISSTRYVHYGSITAKLKTGRWNGVVTAFILMSNVKDEIDVEMPGDQTLQFQSNYFWEGLVTNPTHGGTHNISSDSFSNYHEYTINWQPESLSWAVDGNVVRTIEKSSTLDAASGVYRYPTTPSRIQFSLWPAGIPGTPEGEVQWAGGMINWADPDYIAAGHFYMLLNSVTVNCSTAIPVPSNDISYVYGANSSGVPTVQASNLTTINAGESPVVSYLTFGSLLGAVLALLAVF
jgi:beta-glucanase (GH16 family)